MILENDVTQKYLSQYVNTTRNLMQEVLYSLDQHSESKIVTAHDLGFPHDLIRLAGGFPTGMYVEWKCAVPFIPVDTTVNVCSTAIFELSDDITPTLNEEYFLNFKANFKKENFSYSFNLDKGNHFIIFAKGAISNKNYLLLHSSAGEFKRGFNGLYPIEGNWYYKSIQTHWNGNRYLRYIIGEKAILFNEIAEQVNCFNKLRLSFMGQMLIDESCEILSSRVYHHYNMPTKNSVVIGGHLVESEDSTPLLTFWGSPIYLLKVKDSSVKVTLDGKVLNLLPHGWGIESVVEPTIKINREQHEIQINNQTYPIKGNIMIQNHPDLRIRNFSGNMDKYFDIIRKDIDFEIVDTLYQVKSFNVNGYNEWHEN